MAKVYDNATDLITFARSSSATYLDSDGVIKTAATDAPRIEYAEDGTLKGLLIEEQRTNLLHNTDNPPTQVANLTAGSHTLSFVGGPSTQTISDSITGTAVDVFVYDTKRDSDGGAWRTGSLAQASSWYAEASSASRDPNTRSTRAEFPAVAVIVAEANKVTIYDGDDPSLPMWMVFNRAGDSYFASGSAACSSVVMSNGLLVFGTVGTREISFLTDSALFRNSSGANDCSEPISGRNSGNTFSGYYGTGIVNNTVNDVAMTVLPDAPTDPATGLPVPTIAVATNGGVSVIKDDGTVVDSYVTFTSNFVAFDEQQNLLHAFGSSPYVLYVYNSYGADGFGSAPLQGYNRNTTVTTGAQNILATAGGQTGVTDRAVGSALGLTTLAPDFSDTATGMVAYTTSTYTTGWMNGDIKLAALANSATADRSVNNNPLTQYGTITATPVATGADVVAYSGFNSSNYLEQPYNADLDFGQGDFCVMGWVRPSVAAPYNMMFSRGTSPSDDIYIYNDGGVLKAKIVAEGVFTSTGILAPNVWSHVTLYRAATTSYLYLNGALVGTRASSISLTNTAAKLVLGARVDLTVPSSLQSLALWRFSATAPTADQIAKIYNDEKLLFQPNAKATLDGTSDAVTALAHDPETNLLHVGTNQSRSVFYGLRRINQTGNAVTTAISAVDGLISEQ